MKNNWKKIRFQDFIKLQRGFDLPARDRVCGDYPIIASTSICGYHNKYKVAGECVTTGRSGALGEVLYVKEGGCWPLNTALWVKDFKGNVPKFVYYFLKTFDLKRFNSGVGVPTLNRNDLDNLEITICNVEDQKRIADVLSAYDDLIENNNRRIKILEEMAQLIYKEWFVDFKFPGHEKVKMIEGDLELMPEGWKMKRIGDIFKTILGGTPSRNNNDFWTNGDILWINSGKVNELRIIDESKLITKEALRKSATKLMSKRTTVLAITGATLGQVSLLEIECCANQSVVGIYDANNIFNEYIYLATSHNIGDIISAAGGGAQQHINKDIINEYEFIIPNKETVIEFNKVMTPIFDNMARLFFKNNNLRQTRDLLLSKLMSGKVNL